MTRTAKIWASPAVIDSMSKEFYRVTLRRVQVGSAHIWAESQAAAEARAKILAEDEDEDDVVWNTPESWRIEAVSPLHTPSEDE